jgi:hypothetical protein
MIRRTGVKWASCRKFGMSGEYVSKRVNQLAAEGDRRWKDLWEESMQLYTDDLVQEVHRRAVEGVDEPVYYRGVEVGSVRRFSDALAISLLKARRPEEFRENIKVDANVTGGVLLLPPKMTVEEFLAQQSEAGDA